MKKVIIYFLLFIIPLMFLSCKEEFSPYMDLEQNYMLYCVLDNRLNSQMVLLQKFHYLDYSKNTTGDRMLFLSEDNGPNYYFRDTVINGNQDYSYFYLPNFKLKRGSYYKLTAVVDGMETQFGELKYFADPKMTNYHTTILETVLLPVGFDTVSSPTFRFEHDKGTSEYYALKIYVDYDIVDNNGIKSGKIEVPIKLKINRDDVYDYRSPVYYYSADRIQTTYPGVQNEKITPEYASGEIKGRMTYTIKDEVFYYIFKFKMPPVSDTKNIHIKRAYVIFYSLDKKLYENLTISPIPKYFIRLDEPVYWTNIKTYNGSGFGYFGASAADTSILKLPKEIIDFAGYTNDQK